jgi:hypothetical protein
MMKAGREVRSDAAEVGMRADRQRCKACGRPDKFNFHVPDDVWRAVVPRSLDGRVVCLACFDDLAAKRDVAYAASLSEIWFSGERATLGLTPNVALD